MYSRSTFIPKTLRTLAAIPSVTGSAGREPQLQMMRTASEILSTQTHVVTLDKREEEHPYFWLRIGQISSLTHRVLLCCHVDTVPIGDPSKWIHAPWGATLNQGIVFGRGVCDMKGGLSAALAAALEISHQGGGVDLLLTSDEESGSLGASAAAATLSSIEPPAGVIICEPTAGKIVRGHRGAFWLTLRTEGKAAHGSTPEKGINAAFLLIDAIARARTSFTGKHDPYLGHDTWNLGTVHVGEQNPNVVPASASATIDYRLVSHTENELRVWWLSQPGVADVTTMLSLPSVNTPKDDPWVRALPAEVAETPCSYFTDGSVLTGVWPQTPIVIWGPGDPQQMHSDNEEIRTEDVENIVDAYVSAILNTSAAY